MQTEQRPMTAGAVGAPTGSFGLGSRRTMASGAVVIGGVFMIILAVTSDALIHVLIAAGITLLLAGLIDAPRMVQPRRRYLGAGIALLYVAISVETLDAVQAPPAFFSRGIDYGVGLVVWGIVALALDLRASRRTVQGS